jgi:CheY-like chemotaxis protein
VPDRPGSGRGRRRPLNAPGVLDPRSYGIDMFTNPFADKKYLVVDDFGDMRTMIKGLLRNLGATDIDAVRDGKEAITFMERNRYDVVLCDYNLGPGKDGQQVLEEARHRRLVGVDAIFVMITAENTREMVMGAVEYEPDSYLSKPFTKELLRTRLDKLFQRKADLSPINDALSVQNYKEAVRLLDERIARKPKNLADLIKLKADLLYESGAYDGAADIYERVLASREVPWARLGLGKVYFAKKQFVEAQETFQSLIANFKSLTPAYDWLAKAQRAMGFAREAQQTLATAVALSPKAIVRQQALGELAMQNKDFGLAESSFEKAVKLGRHSIYNHPSLHAGLAKSKTAGGKHEEAMGVVRAIADAFDGSPEAAFYAKASEATVLQNQGDTAAAENCLAEAEKRVRDLGHAGPADVSLELARVSLHLGHKEKAAEILRTAVENNHEDEEVLRQVTEAYREHKLGDNPEGAVQDIRQGIVDMNNRGVKLITSGEFDAAIALFEKAAEAMAGNKVVALNAARSLILKMEKQGKVREEMAKASKYIERCKQLAPNDARLLQVLKRYQRLVAG